MGKYYYCSVENSDGKAVPEEEPKPIIWEKIRKWQNKNNFFRIVLPGNFIELTFLIFFLVSIFSPLLLRIFDLGGVGWLFDQNGSFNDEPIGEIAIVLAPLLALALAIERVVETIFDYFEGTIENIVEISTLSLEEFRKLQGKLNQAWGTVNKVDTNLPSVSSETLRESFTPLAAAEQQVTLFSQYLLEIPKDPKYLAYKKRMAILISCSLGFIVAIWTNDHGLLAYLKIEVPRIFDILITGIALGAGVEPMHSLIGALDGLKGALKNLSFSPARS